MREIINKYELIAIAFGCSALWNIYIEGNPIKIASAIVIAFVFTASGWISKEIKAIK